MKKSVAYLFTGVLLSIFGWLTLYWWISIWRETKTFAQNKELFLKKFTLQLQDGTLIEVITLVLSGLSLYLFLKARKDPDLKIAAAILIVLTAIRFFFSLFSLA